MVIYTVCIDPERGRYMAVSADDGSAVAISGYSELEAVGMLVRQCVNDGPVTVHRVEALNTDKKP